MEHEGSTKRDRSSLVLRSNQFFRQDDLELKAMANALGVSKSDLVRGMIAVSLDQLAKERTLEQRTGLTNRSALNEFVEAGRLPRAADPAPSKSFEKAQLALEDKKLEEVTSEMGAEPRPVPARHYFGMQVLPGWPAHA